MTDRAIYLVASGARSLAPPGFGPQRSQSADNGEARDAASIAPSSHKKGQRRATTERETELVAARRHSDLHHVLSAHPVAEGVVVRGFRPEHARCSGVRTTLSP
jgi:hypothetical protein